MKKFRFEKIVHYGSENLPGLEVGYSCKTKIYAVLPRKAWEAINQAENGKNHWEDPALIYEDAVPGTEMSETALTIINALGAEEEEEEK